MIHYNSSNRGICIFLFQFVSYILDQLIDLIAVGSLIVTYGEMPNSSTKI